jgi:hypothetical protein
MPFVRRSATGQIESLHRHQGEEAREFLAEDHPDVLAFLGVAPPRREDFDRLDADFVRVIEDVIDTLIIKNVINITDLPAEAQAKLFARKTFRERITKHSLRLFGDSGFADVVDDTGFTDLPR